MPAFGAIVLMLAIAVVIFGFGFFSGAFAATLFFDEDERER